MSCEKPWPDMITMVYVRATWIISVQIGVVGSQAFLKRIHDDWREIPCSILNVCLSFIHSSGPCLTIATWRRRKNFSQWERSFLWKLRCHWLRGLRQRQIAVVRQCPVSSTFVKYIHSKFVSRIYVIKCFAASYAQIHEVHVAFWGKY